MTQQDKWYFQNILFGILGGWFFAAIWFLIGTLFYITLIGRPAGLVAAPVGMQLERQLEDWQWQR